ncbi:MAG: flavin reductase [Chloroflexi bacterium]|nr:flavin reductase [Chloroflexota bacterium]
MAVNQSTLRDTLRFWGSGVAVVATLSDGAQDFKYAGMTLSSFTSLSLEPPQILICIDKNSATTGFLLNAGVFTISILSGDQAELSDRFAGRTPLPSHGDRFVGVEYETAVTGAPILHDALAWLDCRVQTVHDGSTHWIVIGSVVASGHQPEAGDPLIYFNRSYSALAPEPARSSR